MEFWAVLSKHRAYSLQHIREIKWEPPPYASFKLNIDRAIVGNLNLLGCATIVRDHNGNWVIGCNKSLGINSNFVAELYGLRDGLL